jgi:hypothetical protein
VAGLASIFLYIISPGGVRSKRGREGTDQTKESISVIGERFVLYMTRLAFELDQVQTGFEDPVYIRE